MRILLTAGVLALALLSTHAETAKGLEEFDFYNDPRWGFSSEDEMNFASTTLTMMNQQACQMTSNVVLGGTSAGEAASETANKAWHVFGQELTPERQIIIYNQIWAVLWPTLRQFSQPEFNRLCIIMREDQKAANDDSDASD